MRLSELQDKDIINIKDGQKIGRIIDVLISQIGQIDTLIIQKNKISIVPNNSVFEVKWNQIKKFGKDVILVDL